MKINKKILFFICFLLIAFAVFIFQNSCLAESVSYDDLLVTELMYDPKGSDTDQTDWIEIYNPTPDIIILKKDLFGLIDEEKLEAASDKIHYLNCHKIESDINIFPKNYIILAADKEKFLIDYPEAKNVFDTTFSLSSAGDFIRLSHDRCATFFIDFSYENSWGGKDNGKTLEKTSLDQKYKKDGWQESCIDGGTPEKASSLKSDCLATEEKSNNNIKIKKDDNIYKNIYANFEINYNGATKDTKYTWNFGDGHKSYLQKTRHSYKETGIYDASITIRGDKKDFQNFKVEVKDYSAPKIKIIKIVPNPKGKDSKEFLVIENKSKNKTNLKNWIIATGWEKLVNHPIRENFVVKPGKSKKLTKKICAFSLNNSQSKIELRYPDGKTAQKLKYNRKKDEIEDDESFDLSGKNWAWNKIKNNAANDQAKKISSSSEENSSKQSKSDEEETSNTQEIIEEYMEIKIDQAEFEAGLGKYSENPSFIAKKQNRIRLISYATRINTPPAILFSGQVAGAYMEKTISPKEEHWLFQITDNLFLEINSGINKIINMI